VQAYRLLLTVLLLPTVPLAVQQRWQNRVLLCQAGVLAAHKATQMVTASNSKALQQTASSSCGSSRRSSLQQTASSIRRRGSALVVSR
jgi:hypothetical protein